MKFTCLRENFHQGLAIVTPLARKATHLPILSNVLIKAEMSGLSFISTNLEMALQGKVRAKVEQEGSFTFPAQLLFNVISSLSGEKIECELKNNALKIICQNFHGEVKGMPSEEYPLIPQIERTTPLNLPKEEAVAILEKIIFAAAKGDPRQELNGVLFSFSGSSLTLAATDSYRLAKATVALEGAQKQERQAIIPGRTLEEVMRIVNELPPEECAAISIFLEENQVMFSLGGVEVVSRLVEGKYTDYQQIIPTAFQTTANISRGEFMNTVKSISLFASSGLYDVTLKFDPSEGLIKLASHSDLAGEGSAEVAAEIAGEPQEAVFNFHYLLDGLHAIASEKVEFAMVDGNSPAILKSPGKEDYLYLLMPIKQ